MNSSTEQTAAEGNKRVSEEAVVEGEVERRYPLAVEHDRKQLGQVVAFEADKVGYSTWEMDSHYREQGEQAAAVAAQARSAGVDKVTDVVAHSEQVEYPLG